MAFPGIHTRKGLTLPTGHSHTLPGLVNARKTDPGSKIWKISDAEVTKETVWVLGVFLEFHGEALIQLQMEGSRDEDEARVREPGFI